MASRELLSHRLLPVKIARVSMFQLPQHSEQQRFPLKQIHQNFQLFIPLTTLVTEKYKASNTYFFKSVSVFNV